MQNKEMGNDKRKTMEEFWSKRALLYRNDPKANTNDIWLREVEINYVNNVIKSHSFNNIMDFGCANGYSTIRIARLNENRKFTGIKE